MSYVAKGLFQLESYDSMNDDDILQTNLNESNNEFEQGSCSSNYDGCPKNVDHSVPFPGCAHESATAKPYDSASVPVPGGDNETPTAKPYDSASVSIPAKITLTADQYNTAISALKRSFKEGYEIMQMLESANVIHKSNEELQQEYVENAVDNAMLEAYENGPVFEAVDRADKNDVKSIVKNIRSSIGKYLKTQQKIPFYKPNLVIRILTSPIAPSNGAAAIQQIWSTRLWQVLGIINVEEGNIKTITKDLTDNYKNDLGEYKILAVAAIPSIHDLFKTKFNWKNSKGSYFLLVDKKVPSELKEMQTTVQNAVTSSGDNANSDTTKNDDKSNNTKKD